MLRRPVEEVRGLGLPVGAPEECAQRLAAYVAAGVRRIFVWPLGDELVKLGRPRETVLPLVSQSRLTVNR